MRRFLTLIMLFLFLLNVLGYYGIFVGLRLKNVQELVQKLDRDTYEPSETITFEIPIAVPYTTDSREYERVDGELEHNGEVYRLVKQRLSGDTLYIVCIKDQQSKKIDQVLSDYVKTFTDQPESGKPAAKTLPLLIKDYIPFSVSIDSHTTGWELSVTSFNTPKNLVPTFSPSFVHPPERA